MPAVRPTRSSTARHGLSPLWQKPHIPILPHPATIPAPLSHN